MSSKRVDPEIAAPESPGQELYQYLREHIPKGTLPGITNKIPLHIQDREFFLSVHPVSEKEINLLVLVEDGKYAVKEYSLNMEGRLSDNTKPSAKTDFPKMVEEASVQLFLNHLKNNQITSEKISELREARMQTVIQFLQTQVGEAVRVVLRQPGENEVSQYELELLDPQSGIDNARLSFYVQMTLEMRPPQTRKALIAARMEEHFSGRTSSVTERNAFRRRMETTIDNMLAAGLIVEENPKRMVVTTGRPETRQVPDFNGEKVLKSRMIRRT